MLHLILTASTDDTRTSAHCVLREVHADGTETTLRVSGLVLPLYEVGLFGEPEAAMLEAAIEALNRFKRDIVSTRG
jgi:hypothetical protein